MSSDEEFQEQLKFGEAAEDIVYDYLIANNSGVIDLRKQKRDEGGGPKLVGTEGSLILPDFGVFNKNPRKGTYTVDVKRKRSLYGYAGQKCFTVDNKFEQYKQVTQIMRYDFLGLMFFFEDRMYFYKESEIFGKEFKSNEYGNGFIYYFKFDNTKRVF